MSNSIYVIKPYRWQGIWVFDDASVGLEREAFVAGADTMIDVATARKGIKQPNNGFLLLFSSTPFPTADFQLDWVSGDEHGNTYEWKEAGQRGWLCPALFKYFPVAPKKLYIQVKSISE